MKADRIIKVIRFNKVFFWAVGFLLVVNCVFFVMTWNAERTKITELSAAYETKRKNRMSENRDTGQARILRAKEDIRNFIETLPQRLAFPDMVREIFEALSRHGLTAGNMSYKPEDVGFENLIRYTTSFSVNGKYPALKAFLADIQNSKRLYCIENVSFTNQSKGEEMVDLNLKISFYLR
jgi:Tfp pilus assembly protein PilO